MSEEFKELIETIHRLYTHYFASMSFRPNQLFLNHNDAKILAQGGDVPKKLFGMRLIILGGEFKPRVGYILED